MILSYSRGRLVTYKRGVWRYEDGVPLDDDPDRPCPRCGRPPTAEGHDACLGTIPGCVSACCGHGVSDPILIMRVEETARV